MRDDVWKHRSDEPCLSSGGGSRKCSQRTSTRPMGMLTKSTVKRDLRAKKVTNVRCASSGIALRDEG